MKFTAEDEASIKSSLQGLARHLADTQSVPPSAVILFRARREQHRLAVARATRPLRIAEGVGLVAPISLAVWTLHRTLSAQPAASLLTPNVLALGGVAAALLVAGSIAMLRLGRQA